MAFRFSLATGGPTVGSVDIQGTGPGNRTFVFTPAGGSAQSAQTVSITVNGNQRSISSVSPFSITIGSTTYTSFSGTVDLSTHTGSGTVSNSSETEGPLVTVNWTTSDASSGDNTERPQAAAAAAGRGGYGSGGQ